MNLLQGCLRLDRYGTGTLLRSGGVVGSDDSCRRSARWRCFAKAASGEGGAP